MSGQGTYVLVWIIRATGYSIESLVTNTDKMVRINRVDVGRHLCNPIRYCRGSTVARSYTVSALSAIRTKRE